MTKLTSMQIVGLRGAARFSEESTGQKWGSAHECHSSPAVMGSLLRRGLVNACWQEENPLHEPRRRWRWYQITPAGRLALQQEKG
jgi:hypothetical protein